MEKILIRDPGWKNFGSGINIPDPQNCFAYLKKFRKHRLLSHPLVIIKHCAFSVGKASSVSSASCSSTRSVTSSVESSAMPTRYLVYLPLLYNHIASKITSTRRFLLRTKILQNYFLFG
jgi:hypothetical protein